MSSLGLPKLADVVLRREAKLTSKSGCGALRRCRWWPEGGGAEIVGLEGWNCNKHQQIQVRRRTTCTMQVVQCNNGERKGDWGARRLTACHHPPSYHRFAPAGQRHQDSQSPRQQWQEVPPGTARKDSRETCNKHRPKPAPQSTRQLRPLRRRHSKNPPTAYDQAGPRSHTRDNEPAARTPAATRCHNTTWGRRRHCRKHLP